MNKINQYLEIIKDESKFQSLVSAKTINHLYEYHVEDSLQLAQMIGADKVVTDVGSGAGFPGVIIAINGAKHVHLVEPRKQRAKFLNHVTDLLNLSATVYCEKIHTLELNHNVIVTRGTGTLRWLLTNVNYDTSTRFLAIKSSNYIDEIKDLMPSTNDKKIMGTRIDRLKRMQNPVIDYWDFEWKAHELHRGIGVIIELSSVSCIKG